MRVHRLLVLSQAIAKIAGIEIPNKEWADIIPMLLGHAANPALPVGPMQAILMTISYLLEEIVRATVIGHMEIAALRCVFVHVPASYAGSQRDLTRAD